MHTFESEKWGQLSCNKLCSKLSQDFDNFH
jgi:hypothetical protein